MLGTGGRVPLTAATILLTTMLAACSSVPSAAPPPQPTPATPSQTSQPSQPSQLSTAAAKARDHVEVLADEIGARYSGTQGEQRAGSYVRSEFERLGYTVETQTFRFNEGSSANFVATKQGESPREVVVGAHYDAVDDGDGADDNASGVAVMLAAAEAVRDQEVPYTIRFVAFGAEEADDMFGSAHYVDELDTAQRRAIVAMINLDSVSAGDIRYVYGDAEDLKAWTRDAAEQLGQPLETIPVSDLHEDSDYYPFQRSGVPFIYFEATNWNLGDRDGFTQVDEQFGDRGAIIHTEYDTLEYVDRMFPGRVDERLDSYSTLLSRILTEYDG